MTLSRPFVLLSLLVILGVPFIATSPSLSGQSASNPAPAAQPAVPDWQTKAGGKMAFDVVSVKPNAAEPSATTVTANMAMGPGDYFSPTGGLFSATNINLFSYIAFAYKVTGNLGQTLSDQVPKWVLSDRFDIQARVAGNPTKDQFRLMMQALLADRFKLAMHREVRQLPVFGLALDKPGKTGPGLQPHPNNAPCSTDPATAGSAAPATVVACGGIQGLASSVPGRLALGGRKVMMELIASSLPGLTGGNRPVIDKTGLTGTFDIHLEFTPQFNGPPPPNFQPDPNGPTFLEALKDQLGLKLVSITGPVDVLVLDHVEHPTPN